MCGEEESNKQNKICLNCKQEEKEVKKAGFQNIQTITCKKRGWKAA